MTKKTKLIYCCECAGMVEAVQVTGDIIYPHLAQLAKRKFWQCPHDDNYVGTHMHSGKPLGSIPTPHIRRLRQDVHRILDPLWKNGEYSRSALYAEIAKRLEIKEFHTAELNSEWECRCAFHVVKDIRDEA